jgi:hypothetical protein
MTTNPDDLLDWCQPNALCAEYPVLENLRSSVVAATAALNNIFTTIDEDVVTSSAAVAVTRVEWDTAWEAYYTTARILAGLDD